MMRNLVLFLAGSVITVAVVFRVDPLRNLALGEKRSNILKV